MDKMTIASTLQILVFYVIKANEKLDTDKERIFFLLDENSFMVSHTRFSEKMFRFCVFSAFNDEDCETALKNIEDYLLKIICKGETKND